MPLQNYLKQPWAEMGKALGSPVRRPSEERFLHISFLGAMDAQGIKSATNLRQDTFRHFGSMAIPQSSQLYEIAN